MNVPFNMMTPPMKLDDGEQVLVTHQGLRKKGIFGNRFGELHVTNRRVAFVKAVMVGAVGAILSAKGSKPMLSFDRAAITKAEKLQAKKLTLLVITTATASERFLIDSAAIDALLPMLAHA